MSSSALVIPQTMAEVKEAFRLRGDLFGYASYFATKDGHGDVVERGAFRRAQQITGTWLKSTDLYLNHQRGRGAIGRLHDYWELDKGLYIRAKLYDTPLGREVDARVQRCLLVGPTPAFSITFNNDKGNDHRYTGGTRYLEAVLLEEISLILPPEQPANPYCLLGPI